MLRSPCPSSGYAAEPVVAPGDSVGCFRCNAEAPESNLRASPGSRLHAFACRTYSSA